MTQDALATLLPPLTYQANPVDTGRPGPELAQVFHAVAADPSVDLVAAYALHEPDAVDLVAAARDRPVPDVPVVLGARRDRRDRRARPAARYSTRGSRWPPSRAGWPQRSEHCSPTPAPVTARPHRRPRAAVPDRRRRCRTTNIRPRALLDRLGHHHAGRGAPVPTAPRPAPRSPTSAARSR